MGTQNSGTIQKTRYVLSEALKRLIEKKRFRKISVGDICQEAMVSRSAFYVHFMDKYELLDFCVEELLRQRREEGITQTPEQKILVLLEDVQKNRRVLQNLFEDNLSREMMEIFGKIIRGPAQEEICRLEQEGVVLPGPAAMLADFCAGGLSGVILQWIQGGFSVPAVEVARCMGGMLVNMMKGQQEGEKRNV